MTINPQTYILCYNFFFACSVQLFGVTIANNFVLLSEFGGCFFTHKNAVASFIIAAAAAVAVAVR